MRTTIRALLAREGVREEDTPYGHNAEGMNDFCITAGDFFQLEDAAKWKGSSWLYAEYGRICHRLEQNATFQGLIKTQGELAGRVHEVKENDPNGYGHMEELRALRAVNRAVKEALEELRIFYRSQAEVEMKQRFGVVSSRLFVYKNTASLGSFADLERQALAFQKVKLPWFRKQPLLLGNMESVFSALQEKVPIGIVGGPCLFGTHEVEVLVRMAGGQTVSYDFSSGRRYDRGGEPELADYLARWRGRVEGLDFLDKKGGVTSQELDSLEVLFAVAEALGAKLAIPIPDISYLKYLYTITEPLKESLRERALQDFRRITQRIADLYLELIDRLKKQYPGVTVSVLHERDEKMCSLFYEQRKRYFQKSGLIRRLTAKRGKTDAIFDYISMLALPYYIWGTPQVLQVDNLDETDSYRKCKKVHKGEFSLSTILYPERLSADGEHTIFNADIAYKEYI